jgi:hypothetical protein
MIDNLNNLEISQHVIDKQKKSLVLATVAEDEIGFLDKICQTTITENDTLPNIKTRNKNKESEELISKTNKSFKYEFNLPTLKKPKQANMSRIPLNQLKNKRTLNEKRNKLYEINFI